MIRHPFHLVDFSPWPITGSIGALSLTAGLVSWFHGYGTTPIVIGLSLILFTIYQWWRDVVREGTIIGLHTSFVTVGLRWGIILFIISEIIFFFAFFWAFFHRSLAPAPEIGCVWPPEGIVTIHYLSVPLLNTVVLLVSGISVTWAHHAIVENIKCTVIASLIITVFLGLYFTYLQASEYLEASFSIADRVYGSTFFVTTGFHGLHVLIGTTFLFACLMRAKSHHFSTGHHLGFEAAAWYWHFVDVVWLLLYVFIYWWGASDGSL